MTSEAPARTPSASSPGDGPSEACDPRDWSDANHRYLVAALDAVHRRVAGQDASGAERDRDLHAAGMAEPPALLRISEAFDLSHFERDVLLLCAGVELDTAVARACQAASGDGREPYACFGLTMAVLPGAHWSATTPSSPLRRWHLVELEQPEAPVRSPLRIDEQVLHALTGLAYLDPRVALLELPLADACEPPPSLQDAAHRLATRWAAGSMRVRLSGRRAADLRAVVSHAALGLGLVPARLGAGALPGTPAERELLARLCERETALSGRCWLVECDDRAPDDGRAVLDFVLRLRAPVAVVGHLPVADSDAALASVEVAPSGVAERRAAWRAALGPTAEPLRGWVDQLAGQFDVGTVGIAHAVDEVGTDLHGPAAGSRLWESCRRVARPRLDDLGERIRPSGTWADLVLPADSSALLRQIAAHVRHRLTVFDDWGFGARTTRGNGVAALFAGPSGTGKTLAAEVLAAELSLDLYRVDLSQVVSKYIGETEKNLRRIFDAAETGGVILLFDEADALFGRRSDVRDSHDRYANIEVSYLLQRMETYRGLAVLTTNLRSSLDTAFLRRLQFVVPFPFPDADGRAGIWRGIFPPQLPTEGLDPLRLARLPVAGGTIRTIALSAAFSAAEAGEPVRMAHLLAAARTEYTKLEKPLTDADVEGWADHG